MSTITRETILNEFRLFMDEPIPQYMDAYGVNYDRIIGKVFVIIEESTVMGTTELKTDKEYVFPIAKVLHVGSGWDGPPTEVGKYVRLTDHYSKTQYNPRYEVWIKNEYSNSNIKDHKVGETPPKVLQNLWLKMGEKLFNPDIFDLYGENWLSDIFYIDSANVVCPIDNPEAFFKTK